MSPRRGWGFLWAGVSTKISLLTELRSVRASTPTELCHSAQRWRSEPDGRGATTLGERSKIKTTLKELWRRDGEMDATPSALKTFWGT